MGNVVATARRGSVSVGMVAVLATSSPVAAATLIVNSADSGDAPAVCNATVCNLYGAAQAAGETPESDVIQFAIPGPGPHVIRTAGQVLTIDADVEIDGFSQPGALANTNPDAPDNASIQIVVDGELESEVGISIAADVTIRGLEVVGFRHRAISIEPEGQLHLTGSRLHGNTWTDENGFIQGTAVWGSAGSTGSVIGGPQPADRTIFWDNPVGPDIRGDDNLIEGIWSGFDPSGVSAPNSYYGLEIQGTGNRVVNCWLNGQGAFGVYGDDYRFIPIVSHGASSIIRGNRISPSAFVGILIDGHAATVEDNEILGTLFSGIVVAAVASPTSEHRIQRNVMLDDWRFGVVFAGTVSDSQVFDNFIDDGVIGIALGPIGEYPVGIPFPSPGSNIALVGNSFSRLPSAIDLSTSVGPWAVGDGPTDNDPGDLDEGPNNLQNFPVVASAEIKGSRTKVKAELDTRPGVYWVQWHADGVPFCKRQRRVGAVRMCGQKVRSKGEPRAISAKGLPAVAPGTEISATATEILGHGRAATFGSTSELSPPVVAVAP